MMACVWADMKSTILPRWVTRVPRTVGAAPTSTSTGLGADEWRTFCTVHLVVTLCHAWGTTDKDSRESRILSNYLDLVTAAKLSLMCITMPDRIVKCCESFLSYLHGMLELFPGTTIQSNQHTCMHIPDILEHMGPGPGWSAWASERSIGELQ